MNIYDQLLQFPLFQGMSHDDLSLVAGHTRFDFVKHAPGHRICEEGDSCTHLQLLLSGTVCIETQADDRGYRFVETMSSPYILQPEAIFGYNQRYTHNYTAQTPVSVLRLSRDEVRRLTGEFLVFRLNLLGIFATQTQKMQRTQWRRPPVDLRERIVRFFAARCVYPAGPKTVYILMTRLADELNDSRLDISRALNAMERDELLFLHRGRIEIPQMERLLMQ